MLVLLGLCALVGGWAAGRVDPPEPVRLDPAAQTSVPRTWFFHEPWVLYGRTDDPRRPPGLAEIGCEVRGDLAVPLQPRDMTVHGSRVLDGVPVAALAELSRSGEDAAVRCAGAEAAAPLWLVPSSPAPPFAPSALGIAGVLLLVLGALVHPATPDLPARLRRRSAAQGA